MAVKEGLDFLKTRAIVRKPDETDETDVTTMTEEEAAEFVSELDGMTEQEMDDLISAQPSLEIISVDASTEEEQLEQEEAHYQSLVQAELKQIKQQQSVTQRLAQELRSMDNTTEAYREKYDAFLAATRELQEHRLGLASSLSAGEDPVDEGSMLSPKSFHAYKQRCLKPLNSQVKIQKI